MNYDLVGDIHGHSRPLIALLEKLDYQCENGIYTHPERKIIFLGDFIDRGPNQRAVIDIVRPMIDSGSALSVMGNHEFNAIAFYTPDPENSGQYLREHSEKNRRQHEVFLAEYENADDYADLISWFRALPLWLELEGLRVVHACWDRRLMRKLVEKYPDVNSYFSEDLVTAASRRDSEEFRVVETLLKGKEIPLPEGQSFYDKDGNPRHEIRMKWWGETETYRDCFLGPDSALCHIPDDPIGADHEIRYAADDPPVFVGHYWLENEPKCLTPNVACLDYSVAAEKGGKLVAYRWSGEQKLNDDNFIWVD